VDVRVKYTSSQWFYSHLNCSADEKLKKKSFQGISADKKLRQYNLWKTISDLGAFYSGHN